MPKTQRRRTGGTGAIYTAPQPISSSPIDTGLSSVKSGFSTVKNKIGSFFSGLMSKPTTSSYTPTTPIAQTVGGKRKRHKGGSGVSGFNGKWTNYGSGKGGSRKRHKGGSSSVSGFNGKWTDYGSAKGGTKRRKKN